MIRFLRVDVPVDLGEEDAGVVRPLDGPVLFGVPKGCERGDDLRVDPVRVHLLGRAGALPVERKEEEDGVPFDRPPDRGAELPLVEVELRLRVALVVEGARREVVVLVVDVAAPVEIIRARLRDDVDETRGRTAELRVGPVRHDDDLLHGVQVEGERGPLAAAVFAEEGVVEVRPVHGDVVLDPLRPLTINCSPSVCTVETPGVSLVKSMKLCWMFGRLLTAFSSILAAPAVRDVSTTGASAVTLISCCTEVRSSLKSRVIRRPTPSRIPSRTSVAKPERVTVTR